MQNNEFNEFDELIREIVQQEIQNYMKNEMIFRGITGQVTKVNDDGTCSVDIVTTVVNNIENKSGSNLQVGDSVTLSERIGSDYSNCFINIKNGHQDPDLTINKLKETVSNLEKNFSTEWKANVDSMVKEVTGWSKGTISMRNPNTGDMTTYKVITYQ